MERWLEFGEWEQAELLFRAKKVRLQLVVERLSKYNHAPEKKLWADEAECVLVVDQTYGDMSVVGAMATEASFQEMLQAALAENPQAQIIVKTHPDVVAGHRTGYLGQIPKHPRIEVLTEDVNPWSVFDGVQKVYTVSSLMGFEALLAGKTVRCFGMPFYAGWGLTEDALACERRTRKCSLDEVFAAAYLKYARYVDPISGKACEIERIIDLLSDRRRHWLQVQGPAFCSDVSPWKKKFLPSFISCSRKDVTFTGKADKAIERAKKANGRWVLWASRETEQLRQKAENAHVPMIRVEDAFLRSVGLGSDLTRPWSLVLDDQGIYYDSSRPSRLETLLRETDFSGPLLERAERVREQIVSAGLTKYNVGAQRAYGVDAGDRKIILVPGQVEDDASILRGSPVVSQNLELLERVRKKRPYAFIIYKPHPDVLVGNRRGNVPAEQARQFADEIITDVSMDLLLSVADEVHTMTSLTGFEALLRGKQVTCYGLPFYAGWGLTEDLLSCERRGRLLTLEQLVAGTLILYPTYVDPKTKQVCSVEDLLTWLQQHKEQPEGPPWKTRLIRFIQSRRQGGKSEKR